jgi:hypothetical protein
MYDIYLYTYYKHRVELFHSLKTIGKYVNYDNLYVVYDDIFYEEADASYVGPIKWELYEDQLGDNINIINQSSFMSRHEAWYTGTDKKLLQICYENNAMDFPITKTLFDPILLITADHLLNHNHKDAHAKSLIMYENFTQVLIDFCTKLEMFTGWLENNGIKYFIFHAPDNKDWSSCNWDFIKQTTAYINLINNNNI